MWFVVRTFGLVSAKSPNNTWKDIIGYDHKEYMYHCDPKILYKLLGAYLENRQTREIYSLLGLCKVMVLVEGSRSSLSPSKKKRKLNGCPLATSARTLEKIKNVSLRKNVIDLW